MKRWVVIAILAVAQFVMILDSTVMNVSISTVAKDLGTTISGMQAAITIYALTMAALMLTGGKLGNIWGRLSAFRIGAVVYGIGSLITALSPNLTVLLIGWSVIEGLGAILVIPAIAALATVNYSGKARVVAFSILGAVTGLAAATGPIIGGFFTTYLSWRYVFASETVIMVVVLLLANKIKSEKTIKKSSLDLRSVVLSASGLAFIVFGALQSKTWGWIEPLSTPSIGGHQIAPFGISIVAYMILVGILIVRSFLQRQKTLEESGRDPLLKASMLSIPVLRSGLNVLLSQYFVIAALFFVIPVYLQTILGLDALQTGIKLLPLSIGLVIFTAIGSRRSAKKAARRISRVGQLCLALGSVIILSSIDVELKSTLFWFGMFVVGAGFGLLASQLGNINMSAVAAEDTAEAGGLQGTFQNLGTSFGTAVIGSIFMLALTSGFTNAVNANPNLTDSTKAQITANSQDGVQIVSPKAAQQYIVSNGGDAATADEISSTYQDAQIKSLREAMFIVFVAAVAALVLSSGLPSDAPNQSAKTA